MPVRIAKAVVFFLLLGLFSANLLIWAAQRLTGIPEENFFVRFPALFSPAVVSQRIHVYDSAVFFPEKNEITVTFADGRRESRLLHYSDFPNPLESAFFFHAWYWHAWKKEEEAKKNRLVQHYFCAPGASHVNWTIRYVGDFVLDLGQTPCGIQESSNRNQSTSSVPIVTRRT